MATLATAGALSVGACATRPAQTAQLHLARAPLSEVGARRLERVQVFYRAGRAYARERGREWQIAEVGRDDLRWAPNGVLFAYLLRGHRGRFQVVVRNVRGDSVNAFALYREGEPRRLDWIDDSQIGYLAAPDKTGPAYIIHAARSGEVLLVHRGRRFTWSPDRKRLAYISGKQHVVKVGEARVWPRRAAPRHGRRLVFSELVWSPDGKGLAFMEKHRGVSRLVVMLVVDDSGGDLTWRLPAGASNPSNKLFWAGNKLIIGESKFKPRFAANWTRVR